MQIQPINNYSIQNKNYNPQFKSVMPVAIWVREGSTGSYGPVLSKEVSKSLMTKIVNCLNTSRREIAEELKVLQEEKNKLLNDIQSLKSKIAILQNFVDENRDCDCSDEKLGILSFQKEKRINERKINEIDIKLGKLDIVQRVKRFIANRDESYARYPFARSFNVDGGIIDNKFKNISFLLTGDDAAYLEGNLGKPIGMVRSRYKGPTKSAEEKIATQNYWTYGFEFVKKQSKKFCKDEQPMELHVKMQAIRSKTGKPRGFSIVNMELFPKQGPNNPFVMTGWIKK